MNWYLAVLKKYTEFNGRARRKEYWMFVLFNLIIQIVLGLVDALAGTMDTDTGWGIFRGLYVLAVLLPSIAVGIRRMHDVGKSGWFILIPIYNLILACTDGDKGPNEYGPDPKAEGEVSANVLDGNI